MGITTNTFDGGIDKDSSLKTISNNQYRDAKDISILNDGSFKSVSPIYGTEKIVTIISNSDYLATDAIGYSSRNSSNYIRIMGVSACKIKKNNIKYDGVTVFMSRYSVLEDSGEDVIPSSNVILFEIYECILDDNINIDGYELRKVYVKEYTNTEILKSSVDHSLSSDNDIDVIYFTNQVDGLMRVRCTFDEFIGGKIIFNDQDIRVLREHNSRPPSPVVKEGGSLICGSYQFSSRMVNSVSGLKTRWSLLSNPIPVTSFRTIISALKIASSGIGTSSSKKIDVTSYFNEESTSGYDYYEIAVVKNITGNGIPKLEAYKISPQLKSPTDTSKVFSYTGTINEELIDINDIIVDDSQIESFKTISIKSNYLIGGNIKYKNLSYDNGNIQIGVNSSIFTKPYNSDNLNVYPPIDYDLSDSLIDFGYFRGEVYRYAISYHDENGNWSFPKTIDFSSSVNNSASAGVVDWKYPSLEDEPICTASATVLNATMGINIDSIRNHPSWAKGFAILRAKRIKDIKAQAVLHPVQFVQPMNASTLYPQGGSIPVSGAQPPKGTFGTFVPKNCNLVANKHIARGDIHCQYYYDYESFGSGSSSFNGAPTQITYLNSFTVGAATPNSVSAAPYVNCCFIPENIYKNTAGDNFDPYIYQPGDILEIIDIQKLFQVNGAAHSESSSKDTSIVSDYVFESTDNFINTGKSNSISSLSFLPLGNETDIIEYNDMSYSQDLLRLNGAIEKATTNLFGDHSGLIAENLNEGLPPINQQMGVIITKNPLIDPNFKFFTNSDTNPIATLNALLSPSHNNFAHNDGFSYNHSVDLLIDSESVLGNSNVLSRNYTNQGNMFLYICNIKRGLKDNRYGDIDSFNEFIFTGAYVPLTQSDIDGNVPKSIDVLGGDCTIDAHTFRISDSYYNIPDSKESGTSDFTTMKEYMEINWGNSFTIENARADGFDIETGRPVPVLAGPQHITVLLESECRGRFINRSLYKLIDVPSRTDIHTTASAANSKTPFSYDYNLDYSIPNYNKIFINNDNIGEFKENFNTRLVYSDVRIYGSSEIGFDRYRIANVFDINESNGAITRLVNNVDKIYCIQERGISYVPILGQIIESADSSSLSVRSSEVIGIPQYISTAYGSEHFDAITKGRDSFYFIDADKRSVIRLSESGISDIGIIGMDSYFDDKLKNYQFNTHLLKSFYDFEKKEYIIMGEVNSIGTPSLSPFVCVFSELSNSWITEYSINNEDFGITGSSFLNGNIIYVGKFSDSDISIHLGSQSFSDTILGKIKEPFISFVINNDPMFPKVFDGLVVDSDYKVSLIKIDTYGTFLEEVSPGNYSNLSQTTNMNVNNINLREGTYRVQSLRDLDGRRMRGTYAVVSVNLQNKNDEDTFTIYPLLNSIATKYRLSENKI